jgi:hypothetical protein
MLPQVRLNIPTCPFRYCAAGCSKHSIARSALPRERFSRVPSMLDSLGVEVPYPT